MGLILNKRTMSTRQAKLDYTSFMKWFSEKYPALYELHKNTITAPVDGEGVTVARDEMDSETYRRVIAITKEYYRNEQTRRSGG